MEAQTGQKFFYSVWIKEKQIFSSKCNIWWLCTLTQRNNNQHLTFFEMLNVKLKTGLVCSCFHMFSFYYGILATSCMLICQFIRKPCCLLPVCICGVLRKKTIVNISLSVPSQRNTRRPYWFEIFGHFTFWIQGRRVFDFLFFIIFFIVFFCKSAYSHRRTLFI